MKECKWCGETKPLRDFGPSDRFKDGRQHKCRSCTREYNQSRRKSILNAPVEPVVEKRCSWCKTVKPASEFSRDTGSITGLMSHCKECARGRYIERTFGITAKEYDTMLEEQCGVCDICERPCKSGRDLAVDHSHDTGKVRGLLCTNCNNGLGRFEDNTVYLEAAINYLRKHLN